MPPEVSPIPENLYEEDVETNGRRIRKFGSNYVVVNGRTSIELLPDNTFVTHEEEDPTIKTKTIFKRDTR